MKNYTTSKVKNNNLKEIVQDNLKNGQTQSKDSMNQYLLNHNKHM